MSDLKVALRLIAQDAGLRAEIRSVAAEMDRTGTAAEQMGARAEAGSNRARRGVQSIGDQLDSAKRSLTAFLAGFVTLQSVRALAQTADAAANMAGKLKLVTSNSLELAAAQNQTFEISQRTSTALGETVTLYSRLGQALESTGISADELGRITETVNLGLVASSASTQESASAIQQLSQAMSSGVLRGEEFIAVNEAAPRIMQALGDSLGKTRGELRKLAEEGALTTEVVTLALSEQADAIASDAAKMPLTLGRAMTQAGNAITRYIGEVDQAWEASATLGQAIVDTTRDMDYLAKGALALTGALTAFVAAGKFAAGSAKLVSGAFTVLGAAVAAFNLGSMFADEFRVVRDAGAYLVIGLDKGWQALRKGVVATAEIIRVTFLAAIDAVQEGIANLLDNFVALANFDLPLGLRADFTYGAGDALTGYAQQLRNAIDLNAEAADTTADLTREFQDSAAASTKLAEGLLDASAAHFDYVDAADQSSDASEKDADAKRKSAKAALEDAQANAKSADAKKAAAEAAKKWAKEASEAFKEFADNQSGALSRAARASNNLLGIEQELAEYFGGPAVRAQQEYEATLRAIEQAYADLATQAPLTAEQEAQAIELKTQAADRLKRELTDLDPVNRAAQEATRNWQRYWGDALGDVSDQFSEWLVDGANSFSDFGRELKDIAKRIIADLISTFLKNKIVVPIVAQITGQGATGGIGQALSGIFGGGGSGGLGGLLGGIFGGGSSVSPSFVGPPQLTTGFGGGLFGNNAGGFGGLGGNALGAAAGLFGMYSAFRSGSPISGAASGAMAGSAIMPGIGTIIGGIVGGLAGLLGGPKSPELRLGGVGQARKPERTFTTALGTMQIGERALGTGGDEMIGLVTEFDKTIAGVIRSFRDGSGQLTAVQATLANWSVDLKGDAITTEAVLGGRFAAIMSAFSADVQAFVGNAGTLEERTQRLADAAFLDAAAASGELMGSFGELAELMGEVQLEGESVSQAYARVLASTQLLDQAMQMSGISSELARENFIDLATGITDAAGGLEQASALWTRYFEVAYTEQERGTAALLAAQKARDAALLEAGLESDATLAQIRSAIDELLQTGGDPARITALLIAADALADVEDAMAALGDTAAETAGALAAAVEDLDAFVAQLDQRFEDVARGGMTEFERRMLGINDQLQEDVNQLQRVRAEMVRRGATTEQLARIDRELARAHAFAAQQAVAAILALREQGRGLVAQFRGISKPVLEAAQTIADAGTQAFEQIGAAANDVYESQIASLQSIQQWLDDQLLGDTSSLTPAQRMAEAQRQFDAALVAAQGGDQDALRRLTQLADVLLREGRAFDPSTFGALEASIRAALQGLVSAGPTASLSAGPSVGGGSIGGGEFAAPIAEAGEEFGASQAELALQIAEIIRQLISATGDSLGEVAASIGIEITELVDALGISLGELTVASTQQLAELAASLGVELAELSQQVGVDLGALADAQSLLNDAVEAEIAALPDAQRARLQPLLDAVEAAADDPEGLARAQAALVDEIADIGGAAADALAPYFDQIDPIDPLLSIDVTLRAGFGGVIDALGAISRGEDAQPEGSFASGNPYVARDMIAQIHRGEAVIDASTMSAIRRYGIPIAQPASGASDALIAELRSLRAEVVSLRATARQSDDHNVQATLSAAELQAAASDRIARAQYRGRRVMS